MIKIIKNLCKSIEQKSKLDLITELLTTDISIEESLELYNKVKSNFMYKMKEKEKQLLITADIVEEFFNNEK